MMPLDQERDEDRPRTARTRWLRVLLLPAVLAIGIGAFFAFGLNEYLTFEALAKNREWLIEQVTRHRFAAIGGFIAAYALVAALSVPGGTILTLTGGFLFSTVPGTIYSVIGATIGATVLFIIARSSFRDFFRARAGGYLQKFERGFRRNALNYLLFLRLVPLFPFWLVNLVPAFLGVSLRVFVIATFIGIIPAALVLASVGNGLGAILDQGLRPDLGIVFRPGILLPLLGLAALALVPIVYRKFFAKPEPEESHGTH